MAQRAIARVLGQQPKRRLGILMLLVLLVASLVMLLQPREKAPLPSQVTEYEIASQSNFNHPTYFARQPNISPSLYQAVAPWLGRLILPTQQETQTADWVWFEVLHAPASAQALVGQTLRLAWSDAAKVQQFVQTMTRPVHFTSETKESQRTGNLHPERLDGRSQVGPLQSLAGARPENDVIVALPEPVVVNQAESGEKATNENRLSPPPALVISREPMQVSGQFYTLVQILPAVAKPQVLTAKDCPGGQPCPGSLYPVRHYNPATHQFDGPEETVLIPQVLAGRSGLFQSTPRHLEKSPAGAKGWYLYGAMNQQGKFVVQAIAPRSLLQLQPDEVRLGKAAGLNYLKQHNWRNTQAHKGQTHTVLIDPTATQATEAIAHWQAGTKALVVHLFGGIGGNKAEPNPVPGTITGHYAYGLAEVVRDPFTNELRLDLQYQQVYSHNPNGIVAGTLSWPEYMGNLQRGWLGTRPVADLLIQFDPVLQDYTFGSITLSPLQELQHQLQIMAARYRIGDGTGAATVKPAQSCVQDSNQAVFATLRLLEKQVQEISAIQDWLRDHPTDPQTLRFQELIALSRDLEMTLVPLGIVRPDWQQNSETLTALAGIRERSATQGPDQKRNFHQEDSLLAQLLSWRTVLPRVAHDQIATLFLNHGAKLWVLRTNQVGGFDPDITPLAPTQLLEQYFIIPNSFSRLIESCTLPNLRGWLFMAGMLLIYGLIALPVSSLPGLLPTKVTAQPTGQWEITQTSLRLLLPVLFIELIFRVLLIPHPTEGVDPLVWSCWVMVSLVLSVAAYPLIAFVLLRGKFPIFWNPTFLTLVGLLSLTASLVYVETGSLWAIALLHWLVVWSGLQLNRIPADI